MLGYFGVSSSTILGLRFRDLIRGVRPDTDSEIEDGLPPNRHGSFCVRGKDNQQSSEPSVSLPPFDVAKRLYAAQYAYIGTIFAFTDPESFEKICGDFIKRIRILRIRRLGYLIAKYF